MNKDYKLTFKNENNIFIFNNGQIIFDTSDESCLDYDETVKLYLKMREYYKNKGINNENMGI